MSFSSTNPPSGSIHVYDPFTLTHWGADWVSGAEAWPEPTWPPTPLPTYLLGTDHGELATALVIEGDFPVGTRVSLRVGRVSGVADLALRADETLILSERMVADDDEAAWEEVNYVEQYDRYQNLCDCEKAAAALGLDLVQVHGLAPEEPFSCALPVIRACAPAEVPSAVRHEPWGVLVDTPAPGGVGGTGRVFAWSALPRERPARLLLAGGLAPDNVGAAIARVRPWGVDASSRLEAAPGIKDAARMAAFIAAVRAADAAAAGVAPEGEVAS